MDPRLAPGLRASANDLISCNTLFDGVSQGLAEIGASQQPNKTVQYDIVDYTNTHSTAETLDNTLTQGRAKHKKSIDIFDLQNKKLKTAAAAGTDQSSSVLYMPDSFRTSSCSMQRHGSFHSRDADTAHPVRSPTHALQPVGAWKSGLFISTDDESEGSPSPSKPSKCAARIPRPKKSDKYYSSKTTRVAWRELEAPQRLNYSHIGRIEETNHGTLAEHACETCTSGREICMAYSETSWKRYHDAGDGFSCARCRFAGILCSLQPPAETLLAAPSSGSPATGVSKQIFVLPAPMSPSTTLSSAKYEGELALLGREKAGLKMQLRMVQERAEVAMRQMIELQTKNDALEAQCKAEKQGVEMKNASVKVLSWSRNKADRLLRECQADLKAEIKADGESLRSIDAITTQLDTERSVNAKHKCEIRDLRKENAALRIAISGKECDKQKSQPEHSSLAISIRPRKRYIGGEQLSGLYGETVRDAVYALSRVVKDENITIMGWVVPRGIQLSVDEAATAAQPVDHGPDAVEVLDILVPKVVRLRPRWNLSLHGNRVRPGAAKKEADNRSSAEDNTIASPCASSVVSCALPSGSENRPGQSPEPSLDETSQGGTKLEIEEAEPQTSAALKHSSLRVCKPTAHHPDEHTLPSSNANSAKSPTDQVIIAKPQQPSAETLSGVKRSRNGEILDPCLRAKKRTKSCASPNLLI